MTTQDFHGVYGDQEPTPQINATQPFPKLQKQMEEQKNVEDEGDGIE